MAGRIFVTGDTHAYIDLGKLAAKEWPQGRRLDKRDYLIVCGDFGLPWGENTKEDEWWLDWLAKKPWTTLFVDGNHENHNLLDAMPVEHWNGGKVHFIRPSVVHLMRGQVFELCGKTILAMGGAQSHDKQYRVPLVSWWPRELPSAAECAEAVANLEKHNWQVDYIITHETPASMVELMALPRQRFKEPDGHSHFLQQILENVEFKHWYHGHYHIDVDLSPRLHAIYNRIVELGDCLAEVPDDLYDLRRAREDFPWLGDGVAAQIAELPGGWGDCVRDALASFEQTCEYQNIADRVALSGIAKHRLGGLELSWRCVEGAEIAECAESALNAVARDLWLATNATCQRCGTRNGVKKRGSWGHISCALCHEALEIEDWR